MSLSPADVLRNIMVADAQGTLPSAAGAWPIHTGGMPNDPDAAICIYDTAGQNDGRLMTGETITHPGIQVRVRAADYPTGFAKIKALRNYLDALHNESILLATVTYTVAAYKHRGSIISLGQEPDNKRRIGFTTNGQLTISEG